MEGISLSDKSLLSGRDRLKPDLSVSEFSIQNFGGSDSLSPTPREDSIARVHAFEEFESGVKKDPQKSSNSQTKEPSLGYLFEAFEPGKAQEKPFEEQFERPAAKVEGFDYKDFDLRDSGIVNTLEKANKKAFDIIANAFEEGRRAEARFIAIAKADSEELKEELLTEAQTQAKEIVDKAQSQAEAIINDAQNQAKDLVSQKERLDKLASEAENKIKQADILKTNCEAKETELDKLKADIENQKNEILKKTAEEKVQILANAKEVGFKEGHAKGLSEGKKQARDEVLKAAEGFFKAMSRIDGIWRELWQVNAPSMVNLAVEAAEAIVNKEVDNGQALATGALMACVDYLQKCHKVVFRVRAQDLEEMEQARALLRDKVDGLTHIEFVADPALGPGDLVMEADAGRLDATIKNRRKRIMDVLRDALDNGLVGELPPPLSASPINAEETAQKQPPANPKPAQDSAPKPNPKPAQESAPKPAPKPAAAPNIEPAPQAVPKAQPASAPQAASAPKSAQSSQPAPASQAAQPSQATQAPQAAQPSQAAPAPQPAQASQAAQAPTSQPKPQPQPQPQPKPQPKP
jgi:flagellar biosynthesis/type III secretory pathway protein FliH